MAKSELWKNNNWKLENDQLIVEADEEGDIITFANKNKMKDVSNKKKGISSPDDNKLLNKATKLAEKIYKGKNKFISQDILPNGYLAYKWKRINNNTPFELDFIAVVLDPRNGELVSVSKRCFSNPHQNSINIDKDKSIELAKKELGSKDKIKTSTIVNVELNVVNPNYYWTNPSFDYSSETKLAYVITFNRTEPTEGLVKIWIDAETGVNLGGCQTK